MYLSFWTCATFVLFPYFFVEKWDGDLNISSLTQLLVFFQMGITSAPKVNVQKLLHIFYLKCQVSVLTRLKQRIYLKYHKNNLGNLKFDSVTRVFPPPKNIASQFWNVTQNFDLILQIIHQTLVQVISAWYWLTAHFLFFSETGNYSFLFVSQLSSEILEGLETTSSSRVCNESLSANEVLALQYKLQVSWYPWMSNESNLSHNAWLSIFQSSVQQQLQLALIELELYRKRCSELEEQEISRNTATEKCLEKLVAHLDDMKRNRCSEVEEERTSNTAIEKRLEKLDSDIGEIKGNSLI